MCNIFVIRNVIEIGNIAKPVEPAFLQNRTGKIQGVDHRVCQWFPADPAQFFIQEVIVKGRIMRNENPIPDPFQNPVDCLFKRRCIVYHLIGDIGLAGDDCRNRHRRFDKHLNAVGNDILFDLYRTEFDDRIVITGQAGRLQVKTDKRTVLQWFVCSVSNNGKPVIGKIHLTAKTNFKWTFRITFFQ